MLAVADASASSTCTTTDACLEAIAAAQAKTQSIAADFVQVKHVQLLDEPLVSRGRFFFRRPDRIRLEITEPVLSTVLINGAKISIPGLSAKDQQGMAMTPAASMFAQLGALFTGDTQKLREGFELTAVASGDEGVDVTLVPRVESWRGVFRRMQVGFEGPELFAQTIRLDDGLGDQLEVSLQNVKRNVDLPASLFEPTEQAPPSGS